jgi:hypothetical protein
MPKSSVSKSETPEYRRLGNNICATGTIAMAPCPQCQKSGVTCIVRKGNKRCGPCTKKNVVCGGNFSQTVFDNLERKKQELRQRSVEGRKLMRVFAKQLLAQDKRQADLERRLDEISRRQEAMLDRESVALGEMDEVAAESGEMEAEIMGFEDDFFLYDDPSGLSSGWSPGPINSGLEAGVPDLLPSSGRHPLGFASSDGSVPPDPR